MIASKDRSGWFGASDTRYVMGNWDTPSFAIWWAVKLGLLKNDYSNVYMKIGNEKEHQIARAIEERWRVKLKLDGQVKIRRLRLRVNLDSETEDTIYEIKTFNAERKFSVSKAYWQQMQVEMFARKKKGVLIAYPLTEQDYKNFFLEVDQSKLQSYVIERDEEFLEEYLKRLEYLAKCLRKGIYPRGRNGSESGF